MVCSWFRLLVYVIIFDEPSVLRSITCFLSCQPIQRTLFFLKAIESPFGSFRFTHAGKNDIHTVPVIFLFLDKKNSARGTAMYLYKGGKPCQVKAALSLCIYHETNHVWYNFYFSLHIWKNYTCNQLNFHLNRTTWIQIWCLFDIYWIAGPLPSKPIKLSSIETCCSGTCSWNYRLKCWTTAWAFGNFELSPSICAKWTAVCNWKNQSNVKTVENDGVSCDQSVLFQYSFILPFLIRPILVTIPKRQGTLP